MELKDCKVAFKRGYKYFRGELVGGRIIKPKQYKHLSDIPKWNKYITIKFYIRKSKSNINLVGLYKQLDINSLYLLMDEIPVAPRVRRTRKDKKIKEPKAKVYKVDKLSKEDRTTLSMPISADLTLKGWEKAWFKVKNKLCLDCVKKCKQSARVTIVTCPNFLKI
jgi:hypothetical protein